MITTTRGLMDEATLDCKRGTVEDEDRRVDWVEYRMPGEDQIIHRSVHVQVKRMPAWNAAQGEAGGVQ